MPLKYLGVAEHNDNQKQLHMNIFEHRTFEPQN